MASLSVANCILDTAKDVEFAVGRNHLVLNAVDAQGRANPQVGSLTLDGLAIEIVHDQTMRQSSIQSNLVTCKGPAADALACTLERLTASSSGRPRCPTGCVEAQVIEVVDGDTINARIDVQEYAVPCIEIDAPEIHHPDKAVEWMGPEATRANEERVSGQPVYLEKGVLEADH